MEIQIRRAKLEELDEVVKLVKPMWERHAIEEPEILNREYLKELDAKSYFKPCFDAQDRNTLYVAIEGNNIVGCCRVEIIDLEGMFNEHRAVYVDDLVVKKSHQRKGIGKMLLKEVEDFTKSKNIKFLKTRVYNFNTEARTLLEGRGYKPVYSESYKTLK